MAWCRPITVKYWDHFPADIGGDLAHKHRLALKEAIDDYDFFISGEGKPYSRCLVLIRNVQ
jgi:hypothetical protein